MTKPCAACGTGITGAAQKRFCRPCRNARYKVTIRTLEAGEHVPSDAPRRYASSHGYVRLRWRVGSKSYVETYEHRVWGGQVTEAEHVHHLNEVRSDNRPENLRPLSSAEHRAAHMGGTVHRHSGADGCAIIVKPWHEDAARLYPTGLSTYQIGKQLGRDAASVYRALVKLGVPMRKEARVAIPNREQRDK